MAENLPQSEPFTGRAGHLSPAQCETLKALKEHLVATEPLYKAELYDDYYLLRFLRARKFDLQKTLLMFTNYLKWRVEFKVDELVATFQFPEQDQVHEIYPRYYHKVGKDGHPVYIEHFAKLNVKNLMEVTTIERLLQKHVVLYEEFINHRFAKCTAAAQMKKKEKKEEKKEANVSAVGDDGLAVVPTSPSSSSPSSSSTTPIDSDFIDSSINILDLNGVSLMQFSQCLSFIKQMSAIAQNYYPEMLHKMYIINASFFFSSCWALIKPFLDENTLKKISVIGTKYHSHLLESVDPENLPKVLGGQCECPEGCDVSDKGPWSEHK